MFENKYASIGKSVLIHAIGLQDNHKISNELDRKASGCFACPHFKASLKNPDCSRCVSCPSRKLISDRYVNEKNRYGYQPQLSMCGIKVLIYLHFFATGCGVIEDFSIRDAAERLCMSQRSVHNSLHSLSENGYLDYAKNRPGSYCVLINDYEDYFLGAKEGGRGYIVLGKEFLEDAVISCRGINELRLNLRMYLNVDQQKNYPAHPESYLTDSKKITDLCRYFPHYMKPVHIRHLMEKKSSVYDIRQVNDSVIYSLRRSYYGDLQKRMDKSECAAKLEEIYDTITDSIRRIFEEGASVTCAPDYLRAFVIAAKASHQRPVFELSDGDREDLLQMAVQYGYELLDRHFKNLLADTNDPKSLKDHFGEYIRSSIEQELYAA